MTDGYVERRRQYVAEIRNSFDTEDKNDVSYDANEAKETSFSFFKFQVLIAVSVFVLFLFLKFTETDIYGYHAADIIELVSDNHYYSELQEFVLADE